VVGAGIAGIACAVELAAAGVPVRVVERARTLGGRMASADLEGRPVDYGAAYFTVRDPEFAAVVEGWRTAGLARQWTSELTVFGTEGRSSKSGPVRWAAPHGLRSLVVDLAQGLDITFDHEVHRVGPGVDGHPADVVVLAMPDPQAERLLDAGSAAGAAVAGRPWRPVIAVTAAYVEREWTPLPAAFVNDHPVLSSPTMAVATGLLCSSPTPPPRWPAAMTGTPTVRFPRSSPPSASSWVSSSARGGPARTDGAMPHPSASATRPSCSPATASRWPGTAGAARASRRRGAPGHCWAGSCYAPGSPISSAPVGTAPSGADP